MITCPHCNRSLPESAFYKHSARSTGIDYACKRCREVAHQSRDILDNGAHWLGAFMGRLCASLGIDPITTYCDTVDVANKFAKTMGDK